MDTPVVAYVMKGYPRLSETFILNEIHLLEKMGVSLHVFAVKDADSLGLEGTFKQIRAQATYAPEDTSVMDATFRAWWAANLPRYSPSHLKLFLRTPRRYLLTF